MQPLTGWSFFKAIFWRRWVKVVASAYALVGFLDFVNTYVIANLKLSYQNAWNRYYVLPGLSWRTWLIAGMVLALVATLEGAYRLSKRLQQSHARTIAELEQERDAMRDRIANEKKEIGLLLGTLRIDGMRLFHEKITADQLPRWQQDVLKWTERGIRLMGERFDDSMKSRFRHPGAPTAATFVHSINSDHEKWLSILGYRVDLLDHVSDQIQIAGGA